MRTNLIGWLAEERSAFRRFAVAIALALLGLLANGVLRAETERNLFFVSLAAIVLSSVYGGFVAGLITTVISSLGLNFYFLGDPGSLHLETWEDWLRIGVFTLTGVLMAVVAGALRFALREMKNAQEKATEALRGRDEFISVASHELKSPLTSLKLQFQLKLRKLALGHADDRAAEERALNSSVHTLARLERLIEDLQDFSRLVHGKLRIEIEPVQLKELLERVSEQFHEEAARRAIPMRLSVESGIIGAWDPFRLEQVVTNLISNSIKYGNNSPIEISAMHLEDLVQIRVVDHGPGISPDVKSEIFNRFERANASKRISGLGLGLYITRNIVELHQGRIWVEDTDGGGATFVVELPLGMDSSHSGLIRNTEPQRSGGVQSPLAP